MKRFVIGDIHGRIEALKEVLEKSRFDYENDKLILLGDVVDGGYNTYEVVEELLKIKNCVLCLGNHDEWFMNHLASGWLEEVWVQQGGANTLRSYGAKVKEADYITDRSFLDTRELLIPVTHQDFFNRGKFYYIENDMLFVHGGIDPYKDIIEQTKDILLWDRNLINYAKNNYVQTWNKVFIGHTTTQNIGPDYDTKPVKFNNLWCCDTGCGWTGKLTIMNIDTEEYWQSKIQKRPLSYQ